MPRFVSLTTAKASDVRMARAIPLPSNSIVVSDRAYLDFSTFAQWNARGIYFVCRSPYPPLYRVLRRQIPGSGRILEDQIVQYTGRYSGSYPQPLPRNTVSIEGEDPLVLINKHMQFAASTISRIYKESWQI